MPTPSPLFNADIFSNREPVFSPVRSESDAALRIAGAVLLPKQSSSILSIEQFGGNEINSNNFKVRTARTTYLLKRLPAGADRISLGRQLALMQWLSDRGVAVGRAVPMRNGDLIGAHEGATWCLLDFVEGDFFSGAEAELDSTAVEVGKLQRTLAMTPASLAPPSKWDYSTEADSEVFRAVCERSDSLDDIFGAEAGTALRAGWERVRRAASELDVRRTEIVGAHRGASHCDLHPHNLLVSRGALRAFIDFESFATMPIDAALGFGTFKLIKQYAVREGLGANDAGKIGSTARVFIGTVLDQAGHGHRDPDRLRLMALAELFRRILVVVRLNMFQGNRAWNHVLPMHLAGLAEIDIIFGR